jgi:N2227-like protein
MITEDDSTSLSSSAQEASPQSNQQQQHQHSLSFAYQTYLRQDVDEQAHWEDVCRAYRQYASFAVRQFGLNHPNRLASLPASQQAFLPTHLQYGSADFNERLKQFKEAAIRNQFCLDCILRHAGQPHSQQQATPVDTKFATEAQLSKVSSVLKSLSRDWSAEGQVERAMAYAPILKSVQTYLPVKNRHRVPKICVPGAGVGRLACELAAAGYTVQGEFISIVVQSILYRTTSPSYSTLYTQATNFRSTCCSLRTLY